MRLIQLFNQGHDFAKLYSSLGYGETWEGQMSAKGATHRLVCTAWNKPLKSKNLKLVLRDEKTRPTGFATSVCAVPLKGPHKVVGHFKLKRRADRSSWPIYVAKDSLAGKRHVLKVILHDCRHRGKALSRLRRMGHAECDRLYRTLRRTFR